MSASKRFLFLDSPNVGGIGHAYVISSDAQVPAEAQLSATANRARNKEPQTDFVAVTRDMVQHDTTRRGHELLICAGAVPEKREDAAVVREVLAELLANHVSPDTLKSEVLHKQGGLIFSAPCLDQITEAFQADPRIQMIRWMAVSSESVPVDKSRALPARPEPKPKKNPLMKWLLLFLLIAAVPFFPQFRKSKDPASENNPPDKAHDEVKALATWAFLTAEDWQRLMRETGGSKAMTAHKEAQVKGLKNVSGEEAKAAVQFLSRWAQTFVDEFPSDTAEKGRADAASMELSSAAKILIQAKQQVDGKTMSSVHGWTTDYMNQRQSYPPGVQQKAKILDNFATTFPGLPSKDIPSKLRGIWDALESFRKEKVDGETEPFHKLVQDKMSAITAPPEGYTTLTFQDAERVNLLQEILGSKEMGLVLFGEPYGLAQSDWKKIKARIQAATGQVVGSSSKTLIAALQKSFLSSAK
ncbi:MAG: hypothetical protein HS117_07095 [Verrucomicrobiaceae bacterium]|nr:hypothetical protein [Verrucomicrobiaceae bacterium]